MMAFFGSGILLNTRMLKLNEIYCGDCIELMGELDRECVSLTVTSPPYNDLRTYDAQDHYPDIEKAARALLRVTRPGGVVVWVIGDRVIKGSETLTSFKHALTFREVGFKLHDTMIYAKNNPTPLSHNRYEQYFEYMFVFVKGSAPRTFNPIHIPIKSPRKVQKDVHHDRNYKRGNSKRGHNDTKIKGNIWYYDVGKWLSTKDEIAFEHPAIFPEELARDHIISWSEPGDLVLDPYVGSGTTCKMAVQEGRNYLGFDLSPKYVEIAEKRLSGPHDPPESAT